MSSDELLISELRIDLSEMRERAETAAAALARATRWIQAKLGRGKRGSGSR